MNNPITQAIEALEDITAGWKYIRSMHGDLYGVGWDRAQGKAEAALTSLRAAQEGDLPPLPDTEVARTAPKFIWLNIFGTEDDYESGFPDNHDGITWCEDIVGDLDVPYIRVDAARLALAAAGDQHEARIEQLEDLIDDLRKENSIQLGRIAELEAAGGGVPPGWKLIASDGHIFNGLCPENSTDPSRDPACPECCAMLASSPQPEAAPAVAQVPCALDVTLTRDEAEYIAAFIDPELHERDDDVVRLLVGGGHSGHGLYAAHPEYSEEGSVFVKSLAAAAAPEAPAQAAPSAGEVERDRKDAERYQWLRRALSDRSINGRSHWFCLIAEGHPEELDAAIDAAISHKEQP